MQCPKCQKDTYDNRAENDQRLAKGEKMRPDFKCKDKACDGVLWRPKEGWGASAGTAAVVAAHVRDVTPPTNVKQPLSSGPPLPWETSETTAALQKLFNVYDVCFDHAFELAHKKLGNDASHEGIAAQAATLFIAASRSNGL